MAANGPKAKKFNVHGRYRRVVHVYAPRFGTRLCTGSCRTTIKPQFLSRFVGNSLLLLLVFVFGADSRRHRNLLREKRCMYVKIRKQAIVPLRDT